MSAALQITITNAAYNGGVAIILANSPSPLPITGNAAGVEGDMQEEGLYNSAQKFLAYRGNDIFTETFEVTRAGSYNSDNSVFTAFADAAAAGAWFKSHQLACARDGVVDLYYNGAANLHYKFPYATILPVQLTKISGCTLFLRYTIKGIGLTIV